MTEVVKFNNLTLPVYYDGNPDCPIFRFKDMGLPTRMLERIEADEYFVGLNGDSEIYITELGLYDLLAIDDSQSARLWRRVVHEQLIELRKQKEMSVSEQFEEWDHAADDYYFDVDTGRLMKSVTVEGGDVIQVEV